MLSRLRSILSKKLSASQLASGYFIRRLSASFILSSVKFLTKINTCILAQPKKTIYEKKMLLMMKVLRMTSLKLKIKINRNTRSLETNNHTVHAHTLTHNWGTVSAGQPRLPAGPSRSGSPGRPPAAAALRLQSSAQPAWSPPTAEMVHTAPDLADKHQQFSYDHHKAQFGSRRWSLLTFPLVTPQGSIILHWLHW